MPAFPVSISNFAYPSDRNAGWPVDTGMVISFIRDPQTFPMNRYIQYIPVKGGEDDGEGNVRFSYYVLGRDTGIRVTNLDSLAWPDGGSRKGAGKDEMTPFRMQTGYTVRRNKSRNVPNGVDRAQPKWDILATEIQNLASIMMTARTYDLWTNGLAPKANWQVDATASTTYNSADASVLNNNAGKWSTGSNDPNNSHYNAIQSSIMQAMLTIKLLTNSKITFADMQLVIPVLDAPVLALAPEIRQILATTREDKLENLNRSSNNWGLPPEIAGLPVVVEDAAIVTDPPSDTGSGPVMATANVGRKFIAPSGTAYILSRPGALDGAPGSPSYSTVQIYHSGGLLEAETFPDAEDRLSRAHVSESTAVLMPAPITGYQITNTV